MSLQLQNCSHIPKVFLKYYTRYIHTKKLFKIKFLNQERPDIPVQNSLFSSSKTLKNFEIFEKKHSKFLTLKI